MDFLSDTVENSAVRLVRLDTLGLKEVPEVRQRFGLDFDDAYQNPVAEKYNLPLVGFDSDFDRTERGMSRKAHPWDNAMCESFIKTLKYEEVYRTEYRDLAEARAAIGAFVERVYNQKRLHSALGYLPPAEFERGLPAQGHKEAAARHLFL